MPDERENIYHNSDAFFMLVNYETVLRDHRAISKSGIDFMILDEVQKVKNFETKTAAAANQIKTNHTLAITGTPIEYKLIDIYSIVKILDPHFWPTVRIFLPVLLFRPRKAKQNQRLLRPAKAE